MIEKPGTTHDGYEDFIFTNEDLVYPVEIKIQSSTKNKGIYGPVFFSSRQSRNFGHLTLEETEELIAALQIKIKEFKERNGTDV